MEPYHFGNLSDNQNQSKSYVDLSGSYEFSQDNLASIPYPEDSCMDEDLSEDIELPPPPGALDNEPLPPFDFKSTLKETPYSFSPPLPLNENLKTSNIPMPETLEINPTQHFPPLPPSPFEDNQSKNDGWAVGTEAEAGDAGCDTKKYVDDSKYSPSKVDSDDENQDAAAKPKVLGKEQAKKRLMAFSLSKQPNTTIKKQIITPTKTSKEKPPNPNKSSGVQEQFRATISAIEEEKKKMMQNMPNYLLQEMNDLTKSTQPIMKSSTMNTEKHKNDSVDSSAKDSKDDSSKTRDASKSKDSSKKGSHRSRSRSRSNRRSASRSRRRRSRSKRKSRSQSRSRRRSRSRSKRSRSRTRRAKEEKDKNYKSEKKDSNSLLKKDSAEDWKSFKSAGLKIDCDLEDTKQINETNNQKEDRWKRSPSPKSRHEFKPTFSYLKTNKKLMAPLRVRSVDHGNSSVLFPEKVIKYTKAKPLLMWSENSARATEFYMSKEMLLENCDQTTSDILQSIIENKNKVPLDISLEERKQYKYRPWYPHQNYLMPAESGLFDGLEADFKLSVNEVDDEKLKSESEISNEKNKEETETENNNEKEGKSKRQISLVNDSYMSDEEDKIKEMVVGDVKVQMVLGINSVKVRSKWDSDYEGENSERDAVVRKEEDMEISTPEKQPEVSPEKYSPENCPLKQKDLKPIEKIAEDSPESILSNKMQSQEISEPPTGNLASEYEEFLKMVSFDSNETPCVKSQESFSSTPTNVEKQKTAKSEEENRKTPKITSTDWDQESDHEQKSVLKKVPVSKATTPDDFLMIDNEKSKKKKNKKIKPKKKIEKVKSKKGKQMKKSGKGKKKKYYSSSTSSSSDSYDSYSDSDSDSDDSKYAVKKKKKKVTKAKKKSKKESSSETDSESDDSRSRKRKSRKKRGNRKKKKTSSDSDEEVENALLKQLDFKKQLIMKKIEEIDSISERSGKKKEKDFRLKKKEKEISEELESVDKYSKSGKKKKIDGKVEKSKKKLKGVKKKIKKEKNLRRSKSSSESYTDSSDSIENRKKRKKEGKKKKTSSESSDDDEEIFKSSKQSKLIDIKNIKLDKKIRKTKKEKKKDYSSSDSDSDDSSSKTKKKVKKKKKLNKNSNETVIKDESSRTSWKENFTIEEAEFKTEDQLRWENKKTSWKNLEKKSEAEKRGDDWEKSSSEEEFKKEGSSWDEEVPRKIETTTKDEKRNTVLEKEVNEKTSEAAPQAVSHPTTDTLKTSLSNFSFNENSFCSYGQELSRDFFFTSSSVPMGNAASFANAVVESRPFQSVSKNVETKKPAESELYSPGHSDSEISDLETNEKYERTNSNSNAASTTRDEVYDPLNCESETSVDNNEIEISSIPLPRVSDILLPGETRLFKNIGVVSSPNTDSNLLKNEEYVKPLSISASKSTSKTSFTLTDFTPVASQSPFGDEKTTPTKKQLMSVKAQPKLKSKAASVFQDESDEENIEPLEKVKGVDAAQNNIKTVEVSKGKISEKQEKIEQKEETIKKKKEERARSRDRSSERDRKRRRSSSRERRDTSKYRASSPSQRRRSRTPDTRVTKEKKEIKSDSFEIEPLKSSEDPNGIDQTVQPIPVLTGLVAPSSDRIWSRSHLPGYSRSEYPENLIDHAESFDIYPSEDLKSRNRNINKDWEEGSGEKLSNEKFSNKDERGKKEKRKSRSRSSSPRKRRRSKSPDRRKSPRRRSASPKRRSSYSPRRKSPKRKSPSRRYLGSRSPDRRRKSRSRSPRKRRGSPSRRSRSTSPRKHRSPKKRGDSPRRKDLSRGFNSRGSTSPRKDSHYSHGYPSNRIPVIGGCEDAELELSPSRRRSPHFGSSMGFSRHIDPAMGDSEMNNSFYSRDYADEFGVPNYSEESNANNLITLKNHDIEKPNSPERLSLDQRIELELGVQLSGSQNEQYSMSNQQFQDPNHFQGSYGGDNAGNDSFYQNSDFNGQYFNGHQQSSYGSFQQYPNSQTVQSSVMQVGNIVEVVPAMQPPPSKAHQIMQVGNVLQVVPSPKVGPTGQMPPPGSHNFGPPTATPLVKTQKATAVVAPSSIIPTPNPEAVINPLIKAIQLEREKRRKEKEKRKAERDARRKARQLRREAKLMSVNEKLKKSVQDEGLMLGQEVEDEELLDGLDLPSPPIPVEIITVSQSTLPLAGKGILISAGFMPKPPSEKKEVKFADGVCPGEGTSTSGGEDIASPPPKPKLPKEKRFKKKKTKVKKKVKVQIIRQIIQDEDDDADDDLSPPPPPPGDPPPVFFARFPFAGDAQFPVYQTQTTTTTLTTVQYPAQSFQ